MKTFLNQEVYLYAALKFKISGAPRCTIEVGNKNFIFFNSYGSKVREFITLSKIEHIGLILVFCLFGKTHHL